MTFRKLDLFPFSGESGEDTYSVGLLLPHHLRTETNPVSEISCFMFSRILDDGKRPKTQ
jgi:hypothetical protein